MPTAGRRRRTNDAAVRWIVLAALCAAVSCGDDDGDRPPTIDPATGGRSATGGRAGTGGRATSGGAGAAHQGGIGEALGGQGGESASGSAGETIDGGAGAAEGGAGGAPAEPLPFPCPSDDLVEPPSLDTVCSPTLAITQRESWLPESGAATLLGVSADELTVLWSTTGVLGVTFVVADRPSLEGPFGRAQIEFEGSVVALSADGLRVVAVAKDGSRYFEVSREVRGDRFSAETDEAFVQLNARAEEEGLKYAGGALSADGLHFAYLEYASDDERYPVRVTHRDDVTEPWPPGEQLELCELEAHGSRPRRPTAFASDGRTLFFYDQERGRGRAAYRATIDDPFEWFIDLAPLGSVYPNEDCDRLYSSGVQGQLGLWIAAVE